MVKKEKSGVYKITCTANGMMYIGSSKNVDSRIHNHKYCLRKGNHHNHYLQEDYNIYGIDGFKFEILEICKKDEYLELEQKYLDKLKPFYKLNNGYNINEKANGVQTTGFRFFVNNCNTFHVKQNGYPVAMPITYDEYINKSREDLCEECDGFTTLDFMEEDLLFSNPEWND